jgi:hypothetical protein
MERNSEMMMPNKEKEWIQWNKVYRSEVECRGNLSNSCLGIVERRENHVGRNLLNTKILETESRCPYRHFKTSIQVKSGWMAGCNGLVIYLFLKGNRKVALVGCCGEPNSLLETPRQHASRYSHHATLLARTSLTMALPAMVAAETSSVLPTGAGKTLELRERPETHTHKRRRKVGRGRVNSPGYGEKVGIIRKEEG